MTIDDAFSPIGGDLLAVDTYFTGNVTDRVEGLEFAPLGERYLAVIGGDVVVGDVPSGVTEDLEVIDFGPEGTNPSETGVMLLYNANPFGGPYCGAPEGQRRLRGDDHRGVDRQRHVAGVSEPRLRLMRGDQGVRLRGLPVELASEEAVDEADLVGQVQPKGQRQDARREHQPAIDLRRSSARDPEREADDRRQHRDAGRHADAEDQR